MPRDRLHAIVVAVAVTVAVALADGAVAADGTVAGRLGGVVPSGDRGAATLRAIDLATGRVAGGDRVGASGRYAMRLPPGTYLVAGAVVDLAAGALRSDVTPPVALRSGQRRQAPLALRPRRPSRRAKRKRRRARAAYVQEDGTKTPGVSAIRFENFDGATGDLEVMNRGLRVLWETQVVSAADRCPFVLLASAQDMVKVRAELELQTSPRVDPATRVRRNLVLPDLIVTGALRSRPAGLAFAVRVRDARTGSVVGALSGLIEGKHFFEAADVQGERLVSLLCSLAAPPPPVPSRGPAAAAGPSPGPPPAPPPAPPVPEPTLPPDPDPLVLAGSFSGDVDYGTLPVAPVPMRLSWNGSVRLARLPYGVLPFVQYRLESGSVTVTLDIDGAQGSGCDIDGTEVIDLAQANPGGLPGALTVDLTGPSPTYRLTLGAIAAHVTGVKSGCDDPAEDGGTVAWPLGSNPLALTIDPEPVTDRFAYSAARAGRPGPADPLYHWTWSLVGA